MCFSKVAQAAPPQQSPAPTAEAYVSPETDPTSPNSIANAVSRKKLKIDLATSPTGTGLTTSAPLIGAGT